ncbi:MAG: protein-glutamate O-methyltransferase CheR [Ruminobacter sp.]|uniref:protein-glutamate O-methyltransferase n=1 Tax=Ruminobacter amylophilus TaxID=867 RepID=A0A662ZJG9_9GAMM|nr:MULTISPECIES: protein-glutamate O-methyltransferase CheR [Ruminobacter]MBQ3774995.1 protein-glutamate O-methyltransferase CheR [Ruminobacter sp.]SFP24419.1 chemotaxis protein methyltransferase CheR [Ruminobacter amylophilus]
MEDEYLGITQKNYALFCDFLKNNSGVDLKSNRAYLVNSRLSPLIDAFGCKNLNEFISKILISNDAQMKKSVIEAMVTHESKWFRDGYPFEFLLQNIIPSVKDKSKDVKIWCAGCSRGQEPYSIAMSILSNCISLRGLPVSRIRIFATDLSMAVLNFARDGVYSATDLSRGLDDRYIKSFFIPVDHSCTQYRISDEVKSMVSFRHHNLVNTENRPFLGKCDAIFCRNVMIYFDSETKIKVLNHLKGSLKTGGYLILGSSEFIPEEVSDMEMRRFSNGVVYQKVT